MPHSLGIAGLGNRKSDRALYVLFNFILYEKLHIITLGSFWQSEKIFIEVK
jgi:hypothetical protein